MWPYDICKETFELALIIGKSSSQYYRMKYISVAIGFMRSLLMIVNLWWPMIIKPSAKTSLDKWVDRQRATLIWNSILFKGRIRSKRVSRNFPHNFQKLFYFSSRPYQWCCLRKMSRALHDTPLSCSIFYSHYNICDIYKTLHRHLNHIAQSTVSSIYWDFILNFIRESMTIVHFSFVGGFWRVNAKWWVHNGQKFYLWMAWPSASRWLSADGQKQR